MAVSEAVRAADAGSGAVEAVTVTTATIDAGGVAWAGGEIIVAATASQQRPRPEPMKGVAPAAASDENAAIGRRQQLITLRPANNQRPARTPRMPKRVPP